MFVCLEGQFERIALFFYLFFESYAIYKHLMLYLLIKQTQTTMKQTETAKAWNRLDSADQLEIIVQGLEDCDVSEGSLFIRLYRNGSVTTNIQTKADNHLTVEAVSNDTLATLFSESFEFGDDEELLEQYAETILTWMNNQK